MAELDGLFVSKESRTVVIKLGDKELPIKVKQLTWAKKNRLMSDCFTFQQNGEMKFDMAKYKRAMLMEMIIEAPWGRTDAIFLDQITSEVGDQLEKIIPEAFSEGAITSFFAQG
jgi:hypothetical protein